MNGSSTRRPTWRRRGARFALLPAIVGLVGLWSGRAEALRIPDQFCTGDPCIISRDLTIDDAVTVDFGLRDVIVRGQLSVGSGSATVRAGSFTVETPGRLRGLGSTALNAGALVIRTVRDIRINSTANLGAVRFNGRAGGDLTLVSSAGNVSASGIIFLENLVPDGGGGNLLIIALGRVGLTGSVSVRGGSRAAGGSVEVDAADVAMTGGINLNGGARGGGFLDVFARGNAVLGALDADGGGDGGEGGSLTIQADGSVTLAARVNARGGESLGFCGDGGVLEIVAGGDIIIRDNVTLNGPIPDCCGGEMILEGAAVALDGGIQISGLGDEGCGGIFETFAAGGITVNGSVDINGGAGGAGDLILFATEDVVINGPISARSRHPFGFGSQFTEITSDAGLVTVTKVINVSGGGSGLGGRLDISGCSLAFASTAAVRADGEAGSLTFIASDAMMMRGVFAAGPTLGQIDLIVGPRANPPDRLGAFFNVAPRTIVNRFLVPCGPCALDDECDDGNPCTDDDCLLAARCASVPNASPCDDGNACTLLDACAEGRCVGGAPKECNDGNPCTTDTCDPTNGACRVNAVRLGVPCNDGDACTLADRCNGVDACIGGDLVRCTETDPCRTPGACDPQTGSCGPSPPAAPGMVCDDGNACTHADGCDGAGTCVGDDPVTCFPIGGCRDAGTCNPASGVCGPGAPSAAGTSCDDGNACTRTDRCDGAGACVGANPIVCAGAGPCGTSGICDPATGVCGPSVPVAAGTACDDANACTQVDRCDAGGACVGANPVICPSAEPCQQAGACNPATGICVAGVPSATGTACDDGNTCTRTDRCDGAGSCAGGDPVLCSIVGACYRRGLCDPVSGACGPSTPAAAGSACDDEDACTQTDRCDGAGACVGDDPVVCPDPGPCRRSGTCEHESGVCGPSAPAPAGTACDDGDVCTVGDRCDGAGACVGGDRVECTAGDQCDVAGACDPGTGVCTNPAAADGTTCDDGNGCTRTDACAAGACVGGDRVECTAGDQCHVAGACDPGTGVCTNPAAVADGTTCDDGNGCTRTDACAAGACVGGDRVECTAGDQCHVAGACDPGTGVCTNPAAVADGTTCDDGNGCTRTDACAAGACVGGDRVECTAGDQCHVAGACDPGTGVCTNPAAVADGTACDDDDRCTSGDACADGLCRGTLVGAAGLGCRIDDVRAATCAGGPLPSKLVVAIGKRVDRADKFLAKADGAAESGQLPKVEKFRDRALRELDAITATAAKAVRVRNQKKRIDAACAESIDQLVAARRQIVAGFRF